METDFLKDIAMWGTAMDISADQAGLRKAAIRLSQATRAGVDFYLQLPVREFIEIYNEVAEECRRAKH